MRERMSIDCRTGFTLIELSIVLVIIGLVIGGVFVGRDLIEASVIRSQLTQIEQLKSAVNTFRVKYKYLPGDLTSAAASEIGATPRSGALEQGDGNGIIGACGYGSVWALGCESALFWSDLSFAGLIPGSFTAATDGPVTAEGFEEISRYLPAARLSGQNSLTAFTGAADPAFVGTCNDRLCIAMVYVYSTGEVAGCCYSVGSPGEHVGVRPIDAFAMDTKMDDGSPFTGSVAGGGVMNPIEIMIDLEPGTYDGAYNNLCLTMANGGVSASDFTYAVSGQYAHQNECSLNIALQ